MDTMTRRVIGDFEQYVVDCFIDAGVVGPTAGTPLTHMCEEKCAAAFRRMEGDHVGLLRRDWRDYSTIGEVANQLRKAMARR